VFFDNMARHMEVTGKTYEQILMQTRSIAAGGGTSIGVGLAYAMDRKLDVQGIAIISDGGENAVPRFVDVYARLCKQADGTPPVYLYWTPGETDTLTPSMQRAGYAMDVFDIRGGVDYYSLPNVVQTMRASRFTLFDEIMNTPLLTLDEVFKEEREVEDEAVA
jgi:hypothetical protein